MTEIPQRVLAIKLRTAIDRAIDRRSPRWVDAVHQLMEENPHGSTSSHVRHNLGAYRRAWLARTTRAATSHEQAARWEDVMVRTHETPAIDIACVRGGCGHLQKRHDGAGCQESDCRCFKFMAPAIRGDAVPEKKG